MRSTGNARWLALLRQEHARRFGEAYDRAAEEWFFEELRQMAERMAAAAHLGPPPDEDDRSIAVRIKSPFWRIAPGEQYWTTEDADPRRVYHDVLIALDEARGINNGQPRLWAGLFDELGIMAGERALHLGCGTGYYTAIAASLVGPNGRVTGIEIDPGLAGPARCSALATGLGCEC